jgi:hypothetical protein
MENVRLERAPFFPFSDPIIPLVLLLEIACWIGPDRQNLRSGPIRCLFSGVEISLKVTGHPFWRFVENRYCALKICPIFIKFSPNVSKCMQNMIKL